MKITEDVCEYTAEQAISEEEALEKGMEEELKEFLPKERGGLREGVRLLFYAHESRLR